MAGLGRRGGWAGAGLNSGFWQDRAVLITGATGLVGSWMTKRLLGVGSEVVCLVRDWVPQSELVRSGAIEKVKVVRGDVRDQELLERTLGEYEIRTVFHLAAQTIVGVANRRRAPGQPGCPAPPLLRLMLPLLGLTSLGFRSQELST